MSEEMNSQPGRNWVSLVVTTLLGIGATVAVGWYQLAEAEKQAVLAEAEREKAVRQELVSIVEEHALNNEAIDLAMLGRLTDQRRREAQVDAIVTVAELVQKAEFNILDSRYLPFDRKQALSSLFAQIYSDLNSRSFAPYPLDTPKADLFNTLARQIQEGNSSEALQSLKGVQEAYAKDLLSAGDARRVLSLPDALSEIVKDPFPLMVTLGLYFLVASWTITRRPELLHLVRRMLRPRLSPEQTLQRIHRYRGAGMPDDLIMERLWRLGVPRAWLFEMMQQQHEAAERASTVRPESEAGA